MARGRGNSASGGGSWSKSDIRGAGGAPGVDFANPIDPAAAVGGGSDSGGDGDSSDGNAGEAGSSDSPREPGKRGPYAKRGGREKGSPAREKVDLNVEGIETVLISLHAMAATFTGIGELALTAKEASGLTQGIIGVAKFYPSVAVPPVIVAWCGLIAVSAKIYGPKLPAIRAKIREKQRRAAQGTPQTASPQSAVHPFPHVVYPAS
jgi:hypothetical protein